MGSHYGRGCTDLMEKRWWRRPGRRGGFRHGHASERKLSVSPGKEMAETS